MHRDSGDETREVFPHGPTKSTGKRQQVNLILEEEKLKGKNDTHDAGRGNRGPGWNLEK